MKFKDDQYTLTSGRVIDANCGYLSPTEDEDCPLVEGYDVEVWVNGKPFTREERKEIADYMIAKWEAWGDAMTSDLDKRFEEMKARIDGVEVDSGTCAICRGKLGDCRATRHINELGINIGPWLIQRVAELVRDEDFDGGVAPIKAGCVAVMEIHDVAMASLEGQ